MPMAATVAGADVFDRRRLRQRQHHPGGDHALAVDDHRAVVQRRIGPEDVEQELGGEQTASMATPRDAYSPSGGRGAR